MSMGHYCYHEHYHVQYLRAPAPPQAVRGREGLEIAKQILLRYRTPGILIGGIAKLQFVWREETTAVPVEVPESKDIDVLIPEIGCKKHPIQWEEGIDWWITHRPDERPTNGSGVGLVWSVSLKKKVAPGLYLLPQCLMEGIVEYEREVFKSLEVQSVKKDCNVRYSDKMMPLPLVWPSCVRYYRRGAIASHCKPC